MPSRVCPSESEDMFIDANEFARGGNSCGPSLDLIAGPMSVLVRAALSFERAQVDHVATEHQQPLRHALQAGAVNKRPLMPRQGV